MKIRKIIATLTVAALFFWAPSLIPIKVNAPVRVASAIIGCGVVTWRTVDTAFAVPAPCPILPHSTTTPWAVIGVGASAVSVILNSIIVSHTQCRELTQQEAFNSIFLPFIGIAFNQQHNHCHH